jgi:hypothetical protein
MLADREVVDHVDVHFEVVNAHHGIKRLTMKA